MKKSLQQAEIFSLIFKFKILKTEIVTVNPMTYILKII